MVKLLQKPVNRVQERPNYQSSFSLRRSTGIHFVNHLTQKLTRFDSASKTVSFRRLQLNSELFILLMQFHRPLSKPLSAISFQIPTKAKPSHNHCPHQISNGEPNHLFSAFHFASPRLCVSALNTIRPEPQVGCDLAIPFYLSLCLSASVSLCLIAQPEMPPRSCKKPTQRVIFLKIVATPTATATCAATI